MLRTRLLWFAMGFSVSAAAIGHFVWRDLLAERYTLPYQMQQAFDSLEVRVSNLESGSPMNSNPPQVEG
ncbi:hypothetical protein MANES_13G057800v8 [Manihot esculenta]|uniref:Uncharacterized protein n=1 Tax=Manihot esculenta TaxID=3983 RepID=A0A2C9UR61_MANES|nr:hypothetical protein MANES_13G057800v8 [Manihot esculenta]